MGRARRRCVRPAFLAAADDDQRGSGCVRTGRRPGSSPSPGQRPGAPVASGMCRRPNGPMVRRACPENRWPVGPQKEPLLLPFPWALPRAGRTRPLRGERFCASVMRPNHLTLPKNLPHTRCCQRQSFEESPFPRTLVWSPEGARHISPGQAQRRPGCRFAPIASPERAKQTSREASLCRPFRACLWNHHIAQGGASRLAPLRLPWADMSRPFGAQEEARGSGERHFPQDFRKTLPAL